MSDNKTTIKSNIDAAINAGLGIGGILATNHNDVLTETLFGAGKYVGIYYNASGALDNIAPPGTFLWNGNDPSQLTNFVVRFAKLSADLDDTGEILNLMAVGGIIRVKDDSGRSFVLVFQSFVSGTDPNLNPIYDVTVQGVADNSNFVYAPTQIEAAGFDMYSAGGAAGGAVNALVGGQGITIDATTPTDPIVNLGGLIDDLVQIDIVESVAATEALVITTTDQTGDIEGEFALIPAGQFTWNIEDSGTGGGSGFSGFDFGIFAGAGAVNIGSKQDDGLTEFRQTIDFNNDITNAIVIGTENDLTNERTRIIWEWDKLRIVTPNVDNSTAIVGQLLQLQNTDGEVEFVSSTGLFVDLATNQTNINGEKTFVGNFVTVTNRLSIVNPAFGGSRLGDSELQTPNIDVQTINFKDTGQATALAMFFTKVPGVGVDGYVTTFKNFVDDVNVISIDGVGNSIFGDVGRQTESTLGLRNDFTGGEFRVFDTFNNDYGAGATVREAQGWVAIHGGGATPKKIGLYRYDTTTYTPIFEVGTSNQFVFDASVSHDGFLTVRNSLVVSSGGTQNIIQMQVTGNTTPYAGLAFPSMFWQNIGGDDIFFLARSGTPDASDDFGINMVNLTDRRIATVPDKDFTFGLDDDAIHDNVAGEIQAIPIKAVPVAGDLIVIEDSAAGFAKKSVDISTLPGGGGGVTPVFANFTPTLIDQGGGATYTLTVAHAWTYTIGRLVYYNILFTGINTVGVPSGQLQIQGIPGQLVSGDQNFMGVYLATGWNVNFYQIAGNVTVSAVPATVQGNFRIQQALDGALDTIPGSVTITGGLLGISGTFVTP